MSKFLKIYNEEKHIWELVSVPDVVVEQKFEDGSNITDSNVIVENEYFSKGASGKTLYDTFTDIGGDLRRLQRNVSWLAEHGGGGSGGGSGGAGSFGIEIISPIVENGIAYVTGKTFTIEFMITGGTDGDICTYSYSYDSSQPTDYRPTEVNKSIKIEIDNTNSSRNDHSIIIYATNPYNVTILPRTIKIYESTITLAFDTATAGKNYENGVLKVSQNDTNGFIPFLLTNGLIDSDVVLQANYNGRIETIGFVNKTTSPQKISMKLWDIIPEVDTDVYYVIEFKATATVSSIGTTIESATIPVRIRVISPSVITVSMGINGKSGDEVVDAAQSSMLNYNFKIYGPSMVASAYYCAKIVYDGNEDIIMGKYYDEHLHEEGFDSYTSNTLSYVETTISSQFYLSQFLFDTGKTLSLYVKAWSSDGAMTGETHMTVRITEQSNEVYPRQYSTRSPGYSAHTMFASWNAYNAITTNVKKWTSFVDGYSFIDGTLLQTENSKVSLDINIQNDNTSSQIISDVFPPYMRIQNKAYATIDFSRYAAEIAAMTSTRTGGNQDGFTISVCTEANEHNDNQHTLFLWGANTADGDLFSGFRIDVNKAQWRVGDYSLSCPISYGSRNMIDFSFVRNGDVGTLRIYLNGILNAAKDIKISEFNMQLPLIAYIGASNKNGIIERFSDFNLYEISIYTKSLNDLQLIVNSKNARFTNIIDYNDWKIKNFISSTSSEPSVPTSVFFNNGEYIKNYSTQAISDIANKSNIPVLSLFFETGSGFREDFFYQKYKTDVTNIKFPASAEYHDPAKTNETVRFSAQVSLQGTTTLGYRIKNLELYVNETTNVKGVEVVKLFQPKKEWFPESQFTLKADVVDSAHANNAVLGEWINNCGLMENNPAMANFNDSTRPKDVDDDGIIHTHVKPGTTTVVDCDEDVTIKHTLEGFPILLFIYFDGGQSYNFIGIYSFNLGRHSYYNMGMKFLKNFSRRGANKEKVSCPKLINYYEEMENLGTVSSDDVYSFEFGNNGNIQVADYPVWSQFNKSVIQSYGEFKYPNIDGSNVIWDKLCTLFKAIAQFKITKYYDDAITTFDGIYPYVVDSQGIYHRDGDTQILQNNQSNADILEHLDTGNTVAYFIIANAFGMTDSLGKNLTLRTWDGGEKWYPAFYDMDSALAIENDGVQNDAVDISIDKIEMTAVDDANVLSTFYHYPGSRYAAYLSKLWGIFRDSQYLYNNGAQNPYYELVWAQLRRSGGKLSNSANFTDMMAERVGTCGEMVYDYDYYMKYIQDAEDTSGTESSINFLHGTRVEFVKDWLKRHLYYLDGVFDVKQRINGLSYTYEDSPYYIDVANFGVTYPETLRTLTYGVQVSTPTFLGITIGNSPYKKYYIDTPNTTVNLYYVNATASNTQMDINGSTLITKIDGLQTGFRSNKISGKPGSLRSLSEFDASNSHSLSNDPLSTKDFIFNQNSALEGVYLNSTVGTTTLETYDVDLSDFNKIVNIDISNSDVTSLKLPQSSLQSLSIAKSNLRSLKMSNQNVLTSVNFDGCNNLSEIEIVGCDGLAALNISDKPLLHKVSIINCASISAITIDNNPALTTVEIGNNANLKQITIRNCKNENIAINVYGSQLTNIIINDVTGNNIINLPSREELRNVTNFDFQNCFFISGIKYGNEPIEMVDDYPVFDISSMQYLNGGNVNFSYITTIKYVRVRNVDGQPFKILNTTFRGCTNLTRIFGNILITDGTSFRDYKGFYLNEPNLQPFNPNENVFIDETGRTNIVIDAGSLAYCFEGTKCSISDVYQVFSAINSGVTDIHGMFGSCESIEAIDNMLPGDLFANCDNVTDISSLFQRCYLLQAILPKNLLLPLKENLTEFNDVFLYCDVYISNDGDNYQFFPDGNKIKTVKGFNPKYDIEDSSTLESWEIEDWKILYNLDDVEEIENSFNNLAIIFDNGSEIAKSNLLNGKTKLKKIVSSFKNIQSWETAVIKHIIGGTGDTYPSGLTNIQQSFTQERSSEISIAIGNTFFGNSNESLVNISEAFNGFKKVIDFDDCEDMHFPYKVFSGCSKIETVAGFFRNMDCAENGDVNTITLPSYVSNGNRIDILGDCTSVKDASHLFANLKNVRYSLLGKGFINNSLENVSYMFDNYDYVSMVGGIPFKLFYEEDLNGLPKKTITNMSYVFRNCCSSGQTYYRANMLPEEELYELNENYVPGSLDENTKYPYVWNRYSYDGTDVSGGTNPFYNRVISSEIYNTGLIAKADSAEFPVEFKEYYSPFAKAATDLSSDDIGKNSMGEDFTLEDKNSVFSIRNYFCPPDIFRYCINSQDTNINGAFYGTSTEKYGLFGTIPPYIFEPISNVGQLDEVFLGCEVLLPHEWGYKKTNPLDPTGEPILVPGSVIPPSLFNGMENLYSVKGLFEARKMWGLAQFNLGAMPSTVFTVSSLFRYCKWLTDSGFGNSNLQHLTGLTDISSMMEYGGPLTIPSGLFSSLYNSKISNCAYFMRSNSSTVGDYLPTLWNYPLLVDGDKSKVVGAFYGINPALAEQVPSDARYYWFTHI